MKLYFIVLFFITGNLQAQTAPSRLHVSPTGNDLTGSGSSSAPYRTIQYAIDKSVNGDTVLVARGIYSENLRLKGKKIMVSSGYLFSKDTLDISATIIDGRDSGDVVKFVDGETRQTRFSGFTVRNGWSGLFITASPHLSDLIIAANKNHHGVGSGLVASEHCGFLLENSLFMNHSNVECVASIFNIHSDSAYVLRNVIFKDNTNVRTTTVQSNGRGGGLYENVMIFQKGSPALGISNTLNGLRLIHCTFISTASHVLNFSSNTYDANVHIVNSVFSSDRSGVQFSIRGNYPRTTISLINSAVKDGYAGISHTPTTNFRDTAGGIMSQFTFRNFSSGDFRPDSLSSLLGAGAGNYHYKGKLYSIPSTDLLGNQRPLPVLSHPDIGVYESPTKTSSYVPDPILSDFSPKTARIADSIMIKGKNLGQTVSVFLQETPVRSFAVLSDSLVKVFVGSGQTGNLILRTRYASALLSGFTYDQSFPSQRNTLIHVSTSGNDRNTVGFASAPFRNIQTAINYAQNGDTILVARGIYYEQIDLQGKKVLLTSQYLYSKDTLDIRNTIIDGNDAGDVVTFKSNEDRNTRLSGFTIRNGWSGLVITSSPHLSNLYITGNRGLYGNGSGLVSWEQCAFLLEHSIFEGNNDVESVAYVGNIHTEAAFEMRNVIFRNNHRVNTGALQSNGRGGGRLYNVLIHQQGAHAMTFQNTLNGLYIINSTLYSSNAQLLGHFNNMYPSNIYFLNSVLSTNLAGTQATIKSASSVNRTNVRFVYSAIKGGLTALSVDTTVSISDTTGSFHKAIGFVDSLAGDLRLRKSSSLIGNGIERYSFNGSVINAPATDLALKSRPTPVGTKPDIGAYEHDLSVPEVEVCFIQSYDPFANSTYSKADTVPLNAGAGYSRYRWSTGDTTQSIHVKYTGGYRVTVTNSDGCTGTDSIFVQFPDTVGLYVSTVNGLCNKQVDVPVRATAFRHMLTMQGSVNWNAADLRLDSISGYGPASMGMDVANFGLTQAGNGRITFSWNDPSGNGLSLADSTTVFTLRFTALGTTIRSVPVTITSTPTPIEFFDAGLVRKSNVQTVGGVNITCEFTISGKVLTPLDQGVRNVTVTLTGGASPLTAKTDSAGNYSFKILPGTYTLTPVKGYEQNKTNGISTLDIALIQAHILQKTPFNASYKVIAGDVNNSQGVTTGDILFLRKLILGTDTTLPDNRLWAMVDGGQTFANPLVPFPFSSTKTFTNQSTDVSHTFRGIKIGDVNYDRNPLLDQAPSGDTLRLFGEWIDTEDGYVTLKVKSRAVSGLLGWQSTLRWDAKQLQLQNTTGLITNLGIGERWKDEGYLTLSWNDPRAEGLSFTEGSTWMELRFRKTIALQRAGIGMTEEKLGTEAFNGNYQSMGVKMEPVELRGKAWNGMLRVYPNPATQYMNLEWKMARAGTATVRLLDAQGRVVHVQRGEYGAGVQRATIRRGSGWSVAGTWMVQVEVDGEVRNVKVVMGGD